MALAEKYFHEYCNSFGTVCRVSILEEGFAGATTELEGQPIPFFKRYDTSSDFKYEPIRPSQGEVRLTFGTGNSVDFDEFWTADERQFQVQHIIDGNLDWIGWVIPNGFAHELKGGVYYATLLAADGLSTLEKIPFSDPNTGEPYGTVDLTYNNGFLFPWILIATEILRKLDLDLNTWSCVPIYEKSMTTTGDTRDADPLATSQANVKVYVNESKRTDIPYWRDVNEVFNCKDVLENLCYQFGAKVYQSGGVWRIKYINADAEYGTGPTQRYWRKYNTLAVYLGQEILDKEVTIPCATVDAAMIGRDHGIRMDDVYSAFRVNYKFGFVKSGDNPVALIDNGDFSVFNNTSKLAAPQGWFRWAQGNNWHLGLREIDLTGIGPADFTTGIVIGEQKSGMSAQRIDSTTHPWNSLRYTEKIPVVKGDNLNFKVWLRFLARTTKNVYNMLFRVFLEADSGESYFLRNNTSDPNDGIRGSSWLKNEGGITVLDDVFYVLSYEMAVIPGNPDVVAWREFNLTWPAIPASGKITFDIMNYAALLGKTSDNFPPLRTYWNPWPSNPFRNMVSVREDTFNFLPSMQVTGLELGKIPNTEELAESLDYVYENEGGNYSLEVDPIEVLHGDTVDEDHISSIVVPTNVSGLKNFWDTIDLKYGYASLGLIIAKSIVNLYFQPFRILEGTIKSEDVDIDTRFEFEALPGRQFMLQRASFNEKQNYIEDATFFEISDIALPAGGTEGENTTDPVLTPTGRIRCEKDFQGLNTGYPEREFIDTNQNSETFNQTSWEQIGFQDFFTCPLGEPAPYYWGTDTATLDPDNLDETPYSIDPALPKEVKVTFTNSGGLYIYFLHLDTLGVVERVYTDSQDDIISDFQYLTDVTIDGFLYRVLRQNYVTAIYDDAAMVFVFSQNQTAPENPPPQGPTTYYNLTSCSGGAPAQTTLVPGGANQQYIWPQSGEFYIWDGTTTTSESNWNGSLQIVNGQFNCP